MVATRVLGGSYEGFAEDDQNPRVLSGSYEGLKSPKKVRKICGKMEKLSKFK